MTIRETLADFKGQLDHTLSEYFDQVITEARKKDAMTAEGLEYAKQFTLAGGKRLRPALFYYGYLLGGGEDRERALKASISVELVHLFLLIHDDIMDRDAIRHGLPTLHEYYAAQARRFFPGKDDHHFGQSMALVMGDMIGALGNQVLYISGFPAERVIRALDRLQSIVSLTVVGQSQDFWIEYAQEGTEEQILAMYENKTSRYTIEGPLHLGYILAGGEDSKIFEALTRYAIPLGIAFQIQDDVLGIFGEEKKIGKPAVSDLVEGKRTLLVARALRLGTAAQVERLQFLLKRGTKVTSDDAHEFRTLLRETGALLSVQTAAREYIATGRQVIEEAADLPAEAREFLLGLAEYMEQREC